MGLEIIKAGLLSTVQDMGRAGFASQGCRRAGVCDRFAMRLANLLVGNFDSERTAPVIESTLRGDIIRFTEDCLIAITGADMPAALDGDPVPNNAPVPIKAGQTLDMGTAASGLRAYLAVGGGIDVPKVMGSCATDLTAHIGGLDGRALTAGDVLAVAAHENGAYVSAVCAQEKRFTAENNIINAWRRRRLTPQGTVPVLRFVPGPQDDSFDSEELARFQRTIYKLDPASDRMGCRMSGKPLNIGDGSDILSDAIVFGSIQITSAGLPIVMMADHQTTGGYAKLGTVISADLSVIAQLRPGEAAAFSSVTPEEARKAMFRQEEKLTSVKERLKSFAAGGKNEKGRS